MDSEAMPCSFKACESEYSELVRVGGSSFCKNRRKHAALCRHHTVGVLSHVFITTLFNFWERLRMASPEALLFPA